MNNYYTTQDDELIEVQAAVDMALELDGQAVIESLIYGGFVR